METTNRNRFTRRAALGLVLACIVGAIWLAVVVRARPILLPDVPITQELQEDSSRVLIGSMFLVSAFGTPWVAIGVTACASLLFFLASYRREAWCVLLALPAAWLNSGLKLLVNRPRPTRPLVAVYQHLTDSSFPSGHVVFYVVFFGFLLTTMLELKRLPVFIRGPVGGVSAALIALVSVSRVYLGVHWTTDVIGGYLVGGVLLYALLSLYFSGIGRGSDWRTAR